MATEGGAACAKLLQCLATAQGSLQGLAEIVKLYQTLGLPIDESLISEGTAVAARAEEDGLDVAARILGA
jgi:hypothetical protein